MSCFGSVIFAQSLYLLKIEDPSSLIENYGVKDEILSLLFELYAKNGDALAN